MIDQYVTFLESNPFVWLVITIICFFGCYFYFRQYSALKTAGRIVRTQTQPAHKKVIDELIDEAEKNGKKEYMLNVLRRIREEHGHKGVKVGHIIWLLHLVETGYPDITDMKIPSFRAEEQKKLDATND